MPPSDETAHDEIQLPVVSERPADPYIGISNAPFSAETAETLRKPIPEQDLDILPTGEIYASQVRYRRILNAAFGVGGWALMPRDNVVLDKNTNMMYRTWALYALGRFVSEATGEQQYQADNDRMSYASAAEAAKSNALTRCCKDLGIASECWDKHFTEKFIADHCVQVWVEGKQKPQWRRKNSKPFYKETGFVDGGSQPPTSSAPAPNKSYGTNADCPTCGGAATVRKGLEKYGGGFFCDKKQGGCGARFATRPGPPAGPDPADGFQTNAEKIEPEPEFINQANAGEMQFVDKVEVGKLATRFAKVKGAKWDVEWRRMMEELGVTKDTMTPAAYDAIAVEIDPTHYERRAQ